MNRSKFITRHIEVKNIELKEIFELFQRYLDVSLNSDLACIIVVNIKKLGDYYNELMGKIYNPQNDPEYIKYNEGILTIATRYADRDEQGNPILDNSGKIVITEQIVECQEAIAKYNEENAEILKKVNGCNEKNNSLMQETVKIPIFTWATLSSVPDNIEITPRLYAYLVGDLVL